MSFKLNTHRSTVVDYFDFVKLNILRVTPQHGKHKVVNIWYGLVFVLEVAVQKVLQLFKSK